MSQPNVESIKLILERVQTQTIVDDHVFNLDNTQIDAAITHIHKGMICKITQWFLARKLKADYTFKHPQNLWHLLLFFVFGKWNWFRHRYIKFTTHIITVKEAYGNIAIPDQKPVVYIQKLQDGVELGESVEALHFN